MTEESLQVAVVGAGPAGLTAAVAAVEHGARVILVDAGDQPGGQFWRHPSERVRHGDDGEPVNSGAHHWAEHLRLRRRLAELRAAGRVVVHTDTQVAAIRETGTGLLLHTHSPRDAGPRPDLTADRLVLATGAYDRQLPIPGWDLPGVFSAGGVQALLKGSGTAPGRRLVIAGTGVFLLPVAVQAAAAGVRVEAVCEANPIRRWLPGLHRATLVSKAVEGAGYALALLRHRIPYRTSTAITEILGTDRVEAVVTSKLRADGSAVPGSQRRIETDTVALGWGFTPQLELGLSLGLQTRTDTDGSLVLVVDDQQHTSHPQIWAAGESTGVGGVDLALTEGGLAGAAAAGTPRRPPAKLARQRGFARTLHQASPVPARWDQWLRPDTTVCRCEEITVAELVGVRDDLAAGDGRTAKGLSRAGMGWCQGRICGFAAACLTERTPTPSARSLAQVGRRPLAGPVSLAELGEWDAEASGS